MANISEGLFYALWAIGTCTCEKKSCTKHTRACKFHTWKPVDFVSFRVTYNNPAIQLMLLSRSRTDDPHHLRTLLRCILLTLELTKYFNSIKDNCLSILQPMFVLECWGSPDDMSTGFLLTLHVSGRGGGNLMFTR